MKIMSTISCIAILCHTSYGQSPLVKVWDKRFGGNNSDIYKAVGQTGDNGYILAGWSDSEIGGDKSQPHWGMSDFWMVKTDSIGNKQWDKRFGGTEMEWLYAIQQTSDGGYILGGLSRSGISGDKSEPCWGDMDYYVVKTDSNGIKQWDKRFGGTQTDWLLCLKETADKGYILGGYSSSPSGGNKSQDTIGATDYWIVKIDSLGNKLWDKTYGGTGGDELISLDLTSDGGYLLGGRSNSGVSGDKSQANWGSNNTNDYWIIKIDSTGIKQWDKTFGGTDYDELRQLYQTTDHGFILAGWSLSGVSGDKTQQSQGASDYWLIKTDSSGNKVWDKGFGGSGFDDGQLKVAQTYDHGYLIAGLSNSPISGDKTESNLGQYQTWLVKTDSAGMMLWDKTIFTTGGDLNGEFTQDTLGCYSFGISTSAGIGGYKTQPNWNQSADFWLIKFCDPLFTASIDPQSVFKKHIAYPNPCTNELNILLPQDESSQIIITDVSSKILFDLNFNKHISINLSAIQNGIYFYNIQTISGKQYLGKFIKR